MSNVHKESLGRMAVFLLPLKKLDKSIERRVEQFLLNEYGGFTARPIDSTGWWKGAHGELHYDVHREYKASFIGKERIAKLDQFLAELARDMDEECIYVETGEDAWLVYALAT